MTHFLTDYGPKVTIRRADVRRGFASTFTLDLSRSTAVACWCLPSPGCSPQASVISIQFQHLSKLILQGFHGSYRFLVRFHQEISWLLIMNDYHALEPRMWATTVAFSARIWSLAWSVWGLGAIVSWRMESKPLKYLWKQWNHVEPGNATMMMCTYWRCIFEKVEFSCFEMTDDFGMTAWWFWRLERWLWCLWAILELCRYANPSGSWILRTDESMKDEGCLGGLCNINQHQIGCKWGCECFV